MDAPSSITTFAMAFIPPAVSPPHLRHYRRPRLQRKQATSCSHLPPSAYTHLSDTTPLCRLIPHIPEPTQPQLHALLRHGFTTFSLPADTPPPSGMLKHNIITPIHITPSTLSTRTKAQHVIDDMLTSLKLDHLYLALISWSDLRDERYIDFIGEMTDLIRVGKVRSVGVSNFPTRELAYLHAQGIRPSCNTARISLLDTRFTTTLKSFCQMHQISLLATSTLGGGFFTERFLGLPQPSRRALTPSLSRFVGMINVWGGWSLFQELLYAMKCVADKHCVSISHVAMRWVLQMGAEGVLVGGAGYVSSNVSVFEFELDDEDLGMLQGVAIRGNDLYSILGDAGSELQGWKANL